MKRASTIKNLFSFQGRKGMSEMWFIISAAIIAFLIVILVLFWFKGSGEGLFAFLNKQIDPFADDDGDKVINKFDLCPNTAENQQVDQNGCRLGQEKE